MKLRRLAEAIGALALLVCAFWLGARLQPTLTPGQAVREIADPTVVSLTVRDSAGARVPIVEPGSPSVIMISASTCGYCARSLADIASIAQGRQATRLRMLTLDGVEHGVRMAANAGVTGVWHAEPDGRAAETMLTLNVPGTPVFLLVDSEAVVRRSMPGYPGRDGLAPWVAVMLGDTESIDAPSADNLLQTPGGP